MTDERQPPVMTLGDMISAERAAGVPWDDLFQMNRDGVRVPTALGQFAMTWSVASRIGETDLTFEQWCDQPAQGFEVEVVAADDPD